MMTAKRILIAGRDCIRRTCYQLTYASKCFGVEQDNARAVGLKPAGFDVTVAENGLEAWNYAQQSRFDLLLTDYDMPGLNAARLCRRLRHDSRNRFIPIIFMTCFGRDLDVSRLCDELQLAVVLEKPFRTSELLSKIRKCLPEEDAQLGDILRNVEVLEASVRSAIRRIYRGQRVQLASGALEGVQGIVVARRAMRRVLIQVSQGGYIEVSEHRLRTAF